MQLLAVALLALLLSGCGSWGWGRRSAGPVGWGSADRQDPALSGNGRVLASVVRRDGRDTVLLQEQPSGTVLPLRHLQRQQPHRSPSLSWNGRYLALLVQEGPDRRVVIEDRATGRLHRLPLPGGLVPNSLSLAPDGRRLAIASEGEGRSRVQLYDLTALLEPDLPAGLPVRGTPGAPP
ncbi:Tol biopolymer transporter periplasmic protein [Cyanobium gracile UHCC 0139]|uniref:Tol biopolymer transporter periplasmic protein n=1 Tax=Cyanobium gracile UHCC 0139 TaxID=3110308 RepID=A0ABU5RXD4_9CYAN|nr:Tol biopolymer transporter periplasmic protein [Cyanobium gracile]MEA5392449.1 Tol biopolymer transporter periplasmic protein [Cyanobium gracile UHCC 0139]